MKPQPIFEEIIAQSWAMLAQGAENTKDPYHLPVLGTTGPHGVELRVVVLRRVVEADRLLVCHTDIRSPKVAHIQHDPRVSWLFYHPQKKTQLRIVATATIHTDSVFADEQWAASAPSSRRCYSAPDAPSTASGIPTFSLPDSLQDHIPAKAGRHNFAVIATRIDSLDWLYLDANGNQRALITWQSDAVSASWLAP